MAESTTQPRLLKLQDVAALLGVPHAAVLGTARSGELLAVRIGRRDPWRVDRRRPEERFDELKAEAANRAASMAPPPSPLTPEPPAEKAVKEKCPETQCPINPRGLPQDAQFMTVGEAAELLGVSWPTVINRIKDGTFEASKSERRWLVRAADVEAALLQKKVARLMAKRARRRSRLRGL
jgi:excisionase family DNA binding protein